jgi:hypothetical protein
MKRKVLFSIVWTLTFTVAALSAGMVAFAILGVAGMASWKEPTVIWIGRVWSLTFFAAPGSALVLSLLGVLPGTSSRRQQTVT